MRVEMPKGWSRRPIGDLGSTYPGLAGKKKDDFGEGKPFVTYKQVFAGRGFHVADCDLVSLEMGERQHRVGPGDVLFTTSSETPEEVASSLVVTGDVPELYLNSFCFGYRITERDRLSVEFAEYLFRGPEFRSEATRLAQGSTRFNISKRRLMEVSLLLPPLPEQKRIAEILSSVDAAIAATQKVIDQTERVKKGLLQTLMTRGIGHTRFKKTEIGEIPESWEVAKLGEAFELQTGPFGSQLKADLYEEHGVPVVMPSNIVDGSVSFEGIARVAPQHRLRLAKHELAEGDLVFGRRGEIGRVALVHGEAVGTLCGSGCLRARPSRSINPGFSLLAVGAHRAVEWLISNALGQTMPNLNTNILSSLSIPLPPIGEQDRIVQVLGRARSSTHRSRASAAALKTLKRGLLQNLLTGRVRVNVA